MNIDNNIFFHCYNIYTLLCASTFCLISHDARIIPSSTERSCITIEHSYYKNNSDHLLIEKKITIERNKEYENKSMRNAQRWQYC